MVAAASVLHEHHDKQMPVYRGSTMGRQGNIKRNQVGGHVRLYNDYFHHIDLVYKEHMFQQRYRMSRDIFMDILQGVGDFDPYFQCRRDATGKLGFTSY